MRYSVHAIERMQARSIREEDLNVLMEHGTLHRQNGGELLYFNRNGRKKLLEIGQERLAKLYVVLSSDDQTVVTVGWRRKNKRLRVH